ncbi:MAG: hypothetical protein IH820_14620 [Bacteroidetes bacterium]|nr:hypothetical protein [Bacteroidota bacterium]
MAPVGAVPAADRVVDQLRVVEAAQMAVEDLIAGKANQVAASFPVVQ